jgi:hypothetical protein
MSASTRWLIALGWGIPLLVALAVLGAGHRPGGDPWLRSAPVLVLLVAPVLPLSLALLGLAWLSGRRRVAAGTALGRADRALLAAAATGVVGCLVLAAATALMYVA